MPDDESRKKLKREMLSKLGGVTLTQIRKTTMEQILPQLKANLLKDWNETDLYNWRDEELAKIIDTEQKLNQYFRMQLNKNLPFPMQQMPQLP